jgi:hypothetical protein
MLKKTKLRALSPGQWGRIRVPDYECWRHQDEWHGSLVGREVDVCVLPIRTPHHDHLRAFEWNYRAAWRNPPKHGATTHFVHYSNSKTPWFNPRDFGMFYARYHTVNWDKQLIRDELDGNGTFLYEPASDDPSRCPGADWSRYLRSICGDYVKPFSNDHGDLICPKCEVTGLVVLDEEQLDRLEQVRDFARSMGLGEQLERQLGYLAGYACHDDSPPRQCVLSYDFAPHSFSFAHYALPTPERPGRKFWFNGGLIYQGPSSPANGDFPALTVSLASGTGWHCHT